MKALITGDCGFIGNALVKEFDARGHTTYGYDKITPAADVRDFDYLLGVMQACHPEVVVHLAAEVGKLNCEQNPELAMEVNVAGTLNVAKACAIQRVPLVYCSTSEVYGDHGSEWVDEHNVTTSNGTPIEPHAVALHRSSGVYALTKAWGEDICRVYAPEGLKIVRPTMPYGPGVPPGPGRRALDNLIWQALTGQPMIVHRGASRSWCWIDDLARGFADVIEKGEPGIYNVGRDDDEVQMDDLAYRIRECVAGRPAVGGDFWEGGGPMIEIVDPPARQTAVKRISCAKLRALGWKPTIDLDEGLPLMVEWVKQWMSSHEGTLTS